MSELTVNSGTTNVRRLEPITTITR